MEIKNADQLLNAVEAKTQAKLEIYEKQVAENGKATEAVKADLIKMTEAHAQILESKDALEVKFQELEQKQTETITNVSRPKTMGESIVDCEDYTKFASGDLSKLNMMVKNTILTVSGSPLDPDHVLVAEDRLNGIVPLAFRQLNILDVVPTGRTNSDTIKYAKEAAFTNSAAETADGAAKPESANTFSSVEEFVRTIPTWLKISKQALSDAPFLGSFVNSRLTHNVRHRLQTQILNGNGTSPNLSGITNTGNYTGFTPTSGENAFESLSRAKYANMGADYNANTILMNPADFGAMERLTRASGDDAFVVAGANALNYVANGLLPQIWGMNVVLSNDVTSGKLLVMDINAVMLFMRDNIQIEMSEHDDTNFQSNLVTIRAELRAAFAVFNPLAIRYGSLTI